MFNIFSVFTLLGGLAFFLYGMHIMGAGLEKLSKGKLQKLLEKLSSNPIMGVVLGAAITALVQSSSATTVVTVGLVNSGIMSLRQAVGIVMGANIGTTITSWIVSLTAIDSTAGFVMQMLKPTSFSPLLALAGVILIMVGSKKGKSREIGQFFIGFALIMFGMNVMSDSVAPLADNPDFANMLVMFKNPLLGILMGALLTAIIQSSAAALGMLQAFALAGLIDFSVALPIIMGQNIGTCITAILSSIGTNKNAKRVAAVHLTFNVVGSIIFLCAAYGLNAIIDFPFFAEKISIDGIALVHTVFNVSMTIVFLPFTRLFEKIACLLVRDGSEKGTKTELLDERLLATPAYAIERCIVLTADMARKAKVNITDSLELIENYSDDLFEKVQSDEDEIDIMEDKLGTFLVKLTRTDLNSYESKQVSKLLHSIADFERISDHAVNIAQVAQSKNNGNVIFSDKAKAELANMSGAVIEILDKAILSFENDDIACAKSIEPLEEVIDMLKDHLKTKHVERLKEGKCTIENGVVFLDLIQNFERISDHCSNIGGYVLELKEDRLDTHEYMRDIKNINSSEFLSALEEFKEKYYINI